MTTVTLTKTEAATSTRLGNKLSALVDSARELRKEARALGMRQTAKQLGSIISTLDAARTRLVEDGPEYFDAARAFINTGADLIASHAAWVGRCNLGRPNRL